MSLRALAGLSVAVTLTLSTGAVGQEAQTAGGDITADEATPLPPVVVSAPKERPRRSARQRTGPAATGGANSTETAATSEQISSSGGDGSDFPSGPVGVFTLGQLDLIGGSTITNEAMWTYNKQSLDTAVNILPGVSTSNSGNSRNEKDVFVRGFDRFRVPLYQDGVRVYLPYDNRLDFNRFLTDDLAEIQVQKGYVSVLNGPGGMGGAINLVSRKPTKAVELEGRSGAVFNGDLDDLNQWSSYAFAGTRQDMWYAQVSGNIVDRDAFNLSKDFNPANLSGPEFQADFPYEKGGDRDRSDFRDWRINTKIGFTPNATDEYAINYTNQQGEKGAPLHVERAAVQGYANGDHRRFWDWPEWDTSSLSWLSKTQLGAASYIKTNAYYNTFDNTTRFFRDPRSTTSTGVFDPYDRILSDSVYDDNSKGGFVELGTELIPMNTLKGAIHYRRDEHSQFDLQHNGLGVFTGRSPTQTQSEETWSFAVENTFHATRNVDFVTGVSYDTNEVLRADGSTDPLPDLDAWNAQGALIYRYSDAGKVYSSVSSRTRFPTLFDRYSTRFSTREPDPNLPEERSTNYEIGWSDTLLRQLRLSSALFYSDIDDSIQTAFTRANGNNSLVSLSVDGETYGLELSADWDVTRALRLGGNYTYMERRLDFAGAANQEPTRAFAIAASEAEGTPRHEIFLYAAWRATNQLTLTPSMEIASDRSSLIKGCRSTLTTPNPIPPVGQPVNPTNQGGCPTAQSTGATARPNYDRIGSYALLNFQAEYAFTDDASLAIGATNILDEDYALADGFPEAGRQFFANIRAKF